MMNAKLQECHPKHFAFVETSSLARGLNKFGHKGREAAVNEIKQLHDRKVFVPLNVKDMMQKECKQAMESLIFLTKKRDGPIKARTCADGSVQRTYINKEDATSLTAMTESILLTATIEAEKGRDIMSADIPNAFVQTEIKHEQCKNRITMKISEALVDMLMELDNTYESYVTVENGKRILYVQVIRALYAMLVSSLLFYKQFKKDLETFGFKVNPYDPCVANRIVNGKQHTIKWHVDDHKSSHVDAKVNDQFLAWLEQQYGSKENPVKATRGKKHDYLAMILDFTKPNCLRVDMTNYVKDMIDAFHDDLSGLAGKCPWNENLFKVEKGSKFLSKEKAETFHTFVAKGLFVAKRARPDIQQAIAYLCTRVQTPNQGD